jgi:hypothetical protein
VLSDVKLTLRVGDTLVPLIFMSDRKHLWRCAGDKTEWPVYITIGNLSSKIRQMPSTPSVVIVGLMLIPIQKRNITYKWLDEEWQTN